MGHFRCWVLGNDDLALWKSPRLQHARCIRAIFSFSDTSPHQLLPRACILRVWNYNVSGIFLKQGREVRLIKKTPAGLATSFTMSLCIRYAVTEEGILNTGRRTREDGAQADVQYVGAEVTQQWTSARCHCSQVDVKEQLRGLLAWKKYFGSGSIELSSSEVDCLTS